MQEVMTMIAVRQGLIPEEDAEAVEPPGCFGRGPVIFDRIASNRASSPSVP
jgi:hypothetical protein